MVKRKRIGITMRVTEAEAYSEPRDTVAQAWPAFLNQFFPELEWILLPNLGESLPAYLEAWRLEGFILTGGNDLGESALRDTTEMALLDYAKTYSLPVVGVCRGLQVLQHYFGGALSACDATAHVATTHSVFSSGENTMWEVNSYHRFGVLQADLALGLRPLALSTDGLVEALCHESLPFYGMQWHPERPGPSQGQDVQWMKTWLGLSAHAKAPLSLGRGLP